MAVGFTTEPLDFNAVDKLERLPEAESGNPYINMIPGRLYRLKRQLRLPKNGKAIVPIFWGHWTASFAYLKNGLQSTARSSRLNILQLNEHNLS